MFNLLHFSRRSRPIALHLGDNEITLLGIAGDASIASFAHLPLRPGIIEDGKILDWTELTRKIRELCASAKPEPVILSRNVPVLLSVPESRSFTHVFRFPKNTTTEALPNAIKEEAVRTIPIDFNQVYWDWRIMNTEDPEHKVISFAATNKEIIQEYIAMCKELGMNPIAVEMETMSLSRALLGTSSGVSVVMDIGMRTTTFAFYDEYRRLNMSVSIPIAGNSLNQVLVDNLHVGWNDAESMKRHEGFDRRITDNRTLIILQERVQAILREFNKACTYYESHFGVKITRMMLAGGASLVPCLDEYLQTNLPFPVERGDPLSRLSPQVMSQLEGVHPIFLAPIIGLALRGHIGEAGVDEINLLHNWEDEQWALREEQIFSHLRWLAFPLAFASFALVSYVIYDYLYLPKLRLEEEASSRILPNVSPSVVVMEEVASSTNILSVATTTDEKNTSLDSASSTNEIATSSPSSSISAVSERVKVLETPTGWLNVRTLPSKTAPVLLRVYPGDEYVVHERRVEWVAIELPDGALGWVFDSYVIGL